MYWSSCDGQSLSRKQCLNCLEFIQSIFQMSLQHKFRQITLELWNPWLEVSEHTAMHQKAVLLTVRWSMWIPRSVKTLSRRNWPLDLQRQDTSCLGSMMSLETTWLLMRTFEVYTVCACALLLFSSYLLCNKSTACMHLSQGQVKVYQ